MQRKDGLPPFERRGMNPFQRFASRLKHGLDAKRREIGAKLDAKRAELDAKREDLVATFMAKHDLGAGVYAPNRAERRTEKKNRKQESARETARGAKVHLVLNSIKIADPAPGGSTGHQRQRGAAAKESENSAPAGAEKKEKKAPNSATAVFGPKLKPQKVTVDDLSANDRAAVLGVPLTARNLAGAAMFAFAVYAVSKAAREERTVRTRTTRARARPSPPGSDSSTWTARSPRRPPRATRRAGPGPRAPAPRRRSSATRRPSS